MKKLLLLLGVSSLAQAVLGALVNYTVDDTSSMITYHGSWPTSRDSYQSNLDYGGAHIVSSTLGATAVFNFTGVAVYYLAPLWPYVVSTSLSLDGGSLSDVNLTDPSAKHSTDGGPETTAWAVRWSATNLTNTTHTLVASIPNGGVYVVVDGFIYTTDDQSSSASSSSNVTGIVLGLLFGFLGLLGLALIFVWWYRRRRTHHDILASRRATSYFLASEFGTIKKPFMSKMTDYKPRPYDREHLSYAAIPDPGTDPVESRKSFQSTRTTSTLPSQEGYYPSDKGKARMSFASTRDDHSFSEDHTSNNFSPASGNEPESSSGSSSQPHRPSPFSASAKTRMSFTASREDNTLFESYVSSTFPSSNDPDSAGASGSTSGRQSQPPPSRTYVDEKRRQSAAVDAPPAYTN